MSYFDNIRTFVRVYELGSMSAAGRDLRISPAVTSSRISQLEERLGVRLFQRTTRSLSPTEQGKSFYRGATEILEAVESAEAQIVNITENLKGSLYVAAPLGVGRRLIAPQVPGFLKNYPEVSVRLRLSDRKVDLTTEGLDLAFFLGQPEDSNLRIWITLNKFFMKPLNTWSNRAQAVCLFTRRTGIDYGLANPTEMTLNAASQLMGYQKRITLMTGQPVTTRAADSHRRISPPVQKQQRLFACFQSSGYGHQQFR